MMQRPGRSSLGSVTVGVLLYLCRSEKGRKAEREGAFYAWISERTLFIFVGVSLFKEASVHTIGREYRFTHDFRPWQGHIPSPKVSGDCANLVVTSTGT